MHYEFFMKLSMKCIHMLLNKNPYLVRQKNNAQETAYDYACKWRDARKTAYTISVPLNKKARFISDDDYNAGFWSTLANELKEYETKARHRMYTYFMNTITDDNPIE
jgi:hypothetical protein